MNVGLPFLSNSSDSSFMVQMRWQLLYEVLLILLQAEWLFCLLYSNNTWSFNSAASLNIISLGYLSPGLFVFPGLHALQEQDLFKWFLHPRGRDIAQTVPSKCVK